MAESGFQSLFYFPEDENEEEKKKKEKEKQLEENPLVNKKSLNPINGKERFVISLDNMGASIEKHYYHFQKFFSIHEKSQWGIKAEELLKLKDVFDASVSSSFHGNIGSKTSAMQQQISGYLQQIGQLTKTLFPMLREIGIMSERMSYYENSLDKDKGDDGARQNEVSLKSTWVEVVEQGVQNPNSVYGMATKLGYVTLPDLFFGINPHGKTPKKQREQVQKILEDMEKKKQFNGKVRRALEKKLIQYYTWKEKTWDEMHHTWKFRLKALKQHYNVIRLYMSWLKPLMTNLRALQMKGDVKAHEIVNAFETSKLELELLAVTGNKGNYSSCVLVRLTHTTRPELHYVQGGQRQVTHTGKVVIEIEPYVVTKEEIDFYQKHTEKELYEMMSGMEGEMLKDIENMLTNLGKDVEQYLREAETGKREMKKKDEEKPKLGLFDPFKGVKDSFKVFVPDFKKKDKDKPSKEEARADLAAKKKMEKQAQNQAWITYFVFKKLNGMLAF